MFGALDEPAVERLSKEELVELIVAQTQRRAHEERVRRDARPLQN